MGHYKKAPAIKKTSRGSPEDVVKRYYGTAGHIYVSDETGMWSTEPAKGSSGSSSSIGFSGTRPWYVTGFDDYIATPEEDLKLKPNKYEITMIKIKEVLEKVYSNDSLRRSVVPLFIGDPGLGKTVIIQDFAKQKGVKLVELITSQMSPFEISGIAMPDKDTKKMMYFNFDKLEDLKDGDILFFDELLNGNPVVLNACLTILEQRKFISGKDLPNIMIIAAANPQGMSPLTPQIKERFIWYTVKFDKEMWKDYMIDKYKISKSIGIKLAELIKNEEFKTNNFYTPRSIDKAVNMLINGVPTPYEGEIMPILNELQKNPFEVAVPLPDGRELAANEMISWLELIRLKFNVKLERV